MAPRWSMVTGAVVDTALARHMRLLVRHERAQAPHRVRPMAAAGRLLMAPVLARRRVHPRTSTARQGLPPLPSDLLVTAWTLHLQHQAY